MQQALYDEKHKSYIHKLGVEYFIRILHFNMM